MIRQQINRYNKTAPLKLTNVKKLIFLFISVLGLFLIIIFAQNTGAQENQITNQINNQDTITVTKEISEQLKAIQESIALSEEQSKKLRQEMQTLTKDKMQLTASLIALAQRIKLAEIEASALEEDLAKSLSQKQQIALRLAGTNNDISNLLAALQRLSLSPAPALLVNSSDALSSARSAILISAILPQLRSRAALVSKDLQDLNIISQKALNEEDMFRANLESLAKQQLQISVLIEAREKQILNIDKQIEQETKQSQTFAQQAKSLEELIANIDKQNEQELSEQATSPATTNKEIARAYANLSRSSPAIPFEKAKGYLTLPAAGVIVTKFGSDDGFGGKSNGISIVTRADAQIIAPTDGWVIYKGPYLNYGQIIIINAGNDYTILLAGLEKTNIKLNQFILKGEPIGTMGQRAVGQGITTSSGNLRPTLYIELRKQDIPFDPKGWWEENEFITQTG